MLKTNFAAPKNGAAKTIRISLIVIVCLLIGKLLFNQPVFIFNYSPFMVSSSSMEPEYPLHSIVFVKKVKFESLKTGDVISYKSDALNGSFALHRIISAVEGGFFTKGDNNSIEDNQLITENEFIGKAVFCLTYFSIIRKPAGFFVFFLLPVSVAVLIYISVRLIKSPESNL